MWQIDRISASRIVAYCAKYVNILENIFLKKVLRDDNAAATDKAPGKQGFPGGLCAYWPYGEDAGFAPAVVGLVIVIQADAEGRHPQQQRRQQLLFVFSGTGQIAADGPDVSVDLPLSFPHGGASSRMMAVTPVIMDSYSRIISSSRASPAGSRW